jgi:hypothetical protein
MQSHTRKIFMTKHTRVSLLPLTLTIVALIGLSAQAGEISIKITPVGGLPVTTVAVNAPEAIVVDLTRGMPATINLAVGQKVVFAGKFEAVEVSAVDADGRPGHVLHKQCLDPRLVLEAWRFHGVFQSARPGTAYLAVTRHQLGRPAQTVLITVVVR